MITVLGVPIDGPIPASGLEALAGASLVIGGARLLGQVAPHHRAETWDLGGRMRELRPLLAERAGQAIVVLASGDPMFYGIGSFLAKHHDKLRILSAPSSVAVACARAGLGWEDMALLSAHGRPMPDVAGALDRAGKVAILTDETHTPAAIGALLGDRPGVAWVCERLGEPEEAVNRLPIAQLRSFNADPLNVVLLSGPRAPRPTMPHIPDEDFERKMPKRGLITKREVRALSLAALGVCAGDIGWDLGAGSGAVAIEMALLGAERVYAVEKNADGIELIRSNLLTHRAPAVVPVHARAPDGLADLPDPDRIFVGGTGGNMAELVALGLRRLRPCGRMVLNLATIENLAECVAALKANGARWSLTQVGIARSSPILDLTRFEAQNPVWIVTAEPATSEAP